MGSKNREVLTDWREYDPDEAKGQDPKQWRPYQPEEKRRPMSPIEALMACGPGDEPELSQLELLALRDVLADALDELDPRERRLIEGRVIEKRSFRSLERELGWKKSHMQRTERRVLARLAEMLQEHPAIKEYLDR